MDTMIEWHDYIDRGLYSMIIYDCGSASITIKNLMIWNEIFYNQCVDSGLSKGFTKFLLAQHIKVMMMVNDRMDLCPKNFILKDDDGATGPNFGNVKFEMAPVKSGPQLKYTIIYGIKPNSHKILTW
jgi:hypothetical protein